MVIGFSPFCSTMIHNSVTLIHQLIIITDDSSTFSASDHFAGLEAEAAHITYCSDYFTLVFSKMSLTCIFYHLQIVFLCNCHNTFHITWLTHDMYRHKGFCSFCDLSLHIVRIELK